MVRKDILKFARSQIRICDSKGEIMSCIRPTKFAHVLYRTRRFEQMLRWYETVFDAKVQYQNPALAFLTYDDEHHRFAFANLSFLQPTAPKLIVRA